MILLFVMGACGEDKCLPNNVTFLSGLRCDVFYTWHFRNIADVILPSNTAKQRICLLLQGFVSVSSKLEVT